MLQWQNVILIIIQKRLEGGTYITQISEFSNWILIYKYICILIIPQYTERIISKGGMATAGSKVYCSCQKINGSFNVLEIRTHVEA